MIERVRRRLRGEIARGAVGTFGLKGVQTGLMFVISLLLARLLGAEGYGAYSFAMSWAMLLLVPALFGTQPLLIRSMATYRSTQEWGSLKGILSWSKQWVLVASLVITGAASLTFWIIADRLEPGLAITTVVALAMVPLTARQRVLQAAMQGLQHVVKSQVPEMLIRPTLFALLLAVGFSFAGDWMSASVAAALRTAAAAVALVVTVVAYRRVLPADIHNVPARQRGKTWITTALPLLWINGITVFNAQIGIILVGILKGVEFTGIYNIAFVISGLIGFALVSINAPLGPMSSRLHAEDNLTKLQSLTTKGARTAFLIAAVLTIAFAIAGKWLLSIVGPEFVSGYDALLVLAIGQIVVAGLGSAGVLLVMTGDQDGVAIVGTVGMAVSFSLYMLLIPRYGIDGAAMAAVSGSCFTATILCFRLHRRLGIDSTVLGFYRRHLHRA